MKFNTFLLVLWRIIISLCNVHGAGLIDAPIIGAASLPLDGIWNIESTAGHSIKGNVPGDLITDLHKSGVIPEPYFETNWIDNSSVWINNNWTYSTTFKMPKVTSPTTTMLVFDGVKMGAEVYLNGVLLGSVIDQFLRYNFSVDALVKQDGDNLLQVLFPSHYGIYTEGRFMACSGEWDWAPFSHVRQYGNPVFTQGIWKSVYLLFVETVAIVHVVPSVKYLGPYPTEILSDSDHAAFEVTVAVHFYAPNPVEGTLTILGNWDDGASTSSLTTLPTGESVVTHKIKASSVNLWWPAGLGAQNLYNVSVSFSPSTNPSKSLHDSRRIGFRVFALVTADDRDPNNLKGKEGSGFFTLRFRVNGANIYSRGGNMIPLEEFEGRANSDAFVYLLKSAVDGNFNTLRIWGGGIYLYDIFYDTCDELGIVLYHDLMYAWGHYPATTPTQYAELEHNIRRLSHHPSIVIWDSCNECGGHGAYAQFLMNVVAKEDQSRSLWPASPSEGWDSGVDTLYSQPNGNQLATRIVDHTKSIVCLVGMISSLVIVTLCMIWGFAATYRRSFSKWRNLHGLVLVVSCVMLFALSNQGCFLNKMCHPECTNRLETHGHYQHGSGYPAVNGDANMYNDLFDPNLPTHLESPSGTGVAYQGRYTSEFGCVAMSSFESMSVYLNPSNWALHTRAMSQRNYPCDSIIYTFWGQQNFSDAGEFAFRRQLYQCMISQALVMKGYIEVKRSGNEFGSLTWQLGEIWPTGGWGSLEYATPVPGQVIGGRWKPLHYLLKSSLFTDVTATCGADAHCYVKNDGVVPFSGVVTVNTVNLGSGEVKQVLHMDVSLAAGAGTMQWFCLSKKQEGCEPYESLLPNYGCAASKVDCMLDIIVTDQLTAHTPVCHNSLPLALPSDMKLSKVEVTYTIHPNSLGGADITLTSSHVAPYTVLTTAAHGRFSDNSFLLLPGSSTIQFIPFGPFDIATLSSSLRVEYAQMYTH